jgi:hypothetical protein
MDVSDLLIDAAGRVSDQVPEVVGGLDVDDLAWQPDPAANSIAWLVWHLTRVADEYAAEYTGTVPRWTAEGWYERFALPFGPEAHGYGHTAEEVAQVRASGELLVGYYEAVAPMLAGYLSTLDPQTLDRVVDEAWDPPVTLGVRMISIIDDMVQHIGQAAYLRGMLDRR